MSVPARKRIRVASAADIPQGGVLEATIEGMLMVICHADGHFYAVSGLCTHLTRRRPLRYGRVVDHCIQCPWHGARFDLHSGICLSPPPGLACLEPLATYQIVEMGDELYLELDGATVGAEHLQASAG